MASNLENHFLQQALAAGLPPFQTEHAFHPGRRWRLDFAWPEFLIALEIEGGTFNTGRHTRPVGFEKDCEKYNAAAMLGWTVFRVTGAMVRDGRALKTARLALAAAREVH